VEILGEMLDRLRRVFIAIVLPTAIQVGVVVEVHSGDRCPWRGAAGPLLGEIRR
jgi:hypothetical protein